MKGNEGNVPGKVRVPSSTKGTNDNAPSRGHKQFGEPSREGQGMPGRAVGVNNLGDAPGTVTVANDRRGDHPTNHSGKPGDADQGHHRYGG